MDPSTAEGTASRGPWVPAVVVVVVIGLVGAGAWLLLRDDGGSPADIDTAILAAYPGSEIIKDDFQEDDSGRYIDGDRFSEPARLVRRYRLAEPVPREEFEAWRDDELPPPGWTGPHVFDANRVSYTRTIEGEDHSLQLIVIEEAGPGAPVSEYQLVYTLP